MAPSVAVRRVFSALACVALFAVAPVADAAAMKMIRDAEIEATLRSFAVPLFKAAGLDPEGVHIHIVQDATVNAFVTGGQRVFLNTGLLTIADEPGQVIGVLAHEIGHIRGGHLARLKKGIEKATQTSLLTMLLGGAVAVASGNLDPLVAGITAGGSVGQRTVLAYTRGMENAADKSGMDLLEKTGQSARGFLDFLRLLHQRERLVSAASNAYARSHPLTSSRIDGVRGHLENSRFSDRPPSPETVTRFKRMRGKLKGFLDKPEDTFREYPEDRTDIEALYARALAFAKKQDIESAEEILGRLLRQMPEDPYLHELRGDILARGGRVDDAIAAYDQAIALASDTVLMRLSVAGLLLDKNTREATEKARENIRFVLLRERRIPSVWRWLATAEGRLGRRKEATIALAEEAYLTGNAATALRYAETAMEMFPEGSPGWLRAQDIADAIAGPDRKRKSR